MVLLARVLGARADDVDVIRGWLGSDGELGEACAQNRL